METEVSLSSAAPYGEGSWMVGNLYRMVVTVHPSLSERVLGSVCYFDVVTNKVHFYSQECPSWDDKL